MRLIFISQIIVIKNPQNVHKRFFRSILIISQLLLPIIWVMYTEFRLQRVSLLRVDFFASKSLTAMLKSLVTTSTFLQGVVFFAFICSL